MRTTRLAAVLGPVALTAMLCGPVLQFAFLNWDDTVTVVNNAALTADGRWTWAWTTRLLEHVQPASWLVWVAVAAAGGLDAAHFHAVNLAAHLLVVALTAVLALRWTDQIHRASRAAHTRDRTEVVTALAAATAAALAGVHPLRMEVVAWISAAPYAIATALALLALVVWDGRLASQGRIAASAMLYALSCAARPVAPGLPLVWLLLGWWHGRRFRDSLTAILPSLAIAIVAGTVEWMARRPVQLALPWSYRLEMALTAPWYYGWRLVRPGPSTALDILPLDPQGSLPVVVAAAAALVALTAVLWSLRRRLPAALVVWGAYLVLLAPASGLIASGLQARADRYAYVPALAVVFGVSGALRLVAVTPWRQTAVLLAATAAVGGAVVASQAALRPWASSRELWTHAIMVNSANDMAHYNLGATLAGEGRPSEAVVHYRAAVTLNPAHADARANLDRLEAATLEQEGNRLMDDGRERDALLRYAEAVRRDPARRHAQGALGMGLASQGRIDDAVPHLQEALRLGNTDSAVPAALGALLAEQGDLIGARQVLESQLRRHPESVALAQNLARVMAATPGLSPADRRRTVLIADRVVEATGGNDPRALDTLAEALRSAGQPDDARRVRARAALLARAQGQAALAGAIERRGTTPR